MLRKTILGLALLAATSASYANEANSTAVLRAGTDLIYRGVDVTGSNGTVGLGLLFDNVVRDGVYVSGDFDTVDVTPVNDNLTVRSDLQVGYANNLGLFDYSVSVARVINPINYSSDYTEFRVKGQYSYVYGEVGQGLSSDVNTDTYFAVGVEGRPLVQDLLLGVSTSFVSYDNPTFGNSNVEWNNLQVYGSYDVWRELDLNFGYSVGGNTPTVDLTNQYWAGVSYTF